MPTFTTLCQHLGLDDSALAILLGYGQSTIRNWRKGHREAPPFVVAQLTELCRVLDAYEEWLQKDKLTLDGVRNQAYT